MIAYDQAKLDGKTKEMDRIMSRMSELTGGSHNEAEAQGNPTDAQTKNIQINEQVAERIAQERVSDRLSSLGSTRHDNRAKV
jgi:hypothetical protein